MHCQHANSACSAVQHGRHPGLVQGHAGQSRGAQRQKAGAAVCTAPGRGLQRRTAQRRKRPLYPPRDWARRYCRAAVHGRHHRGIQGRSAAAPQRDCQRAAGRGLVRPHAQGLAGRWRTNHQCVRPAAVPHLRVYGEHDAVDAHWRQKHLDPQSARFESDAQRAVQAALSHLPGGQYPVQRLGPPPGF